MISLIDLYLINFKKDLRANRNPQELQAYIYEVVDHT